MLTTKQWKARSEPHLYPEISIPLRRRTHRVIPCRVGNISIPGCWVDAGSASQFSGSFPLTAIEVLPPNGEAFTDLERVRSVMQRLMYYAMDRKDKQVASAYAYPHFTEGSEPKLTLMALYVGFESTIQVVRDVFVP